MGACPHGADGAGAVPRVRASTGTAPAAEDDGPAGFDALRRQWDRAWVRPNARLLKVDERQRSGRVQVSVLTTVIGGAARELGDCGDETEAQEIVDEVCGILVHLSAPPG